MIDEGNEDISLVKGSLAARHQDQIDQGLHPNADNSDRKDNHSNIDGLSSEIALFTLHQDIKQEIDRIKMEFSKRKFLSWLQESLSFGSELSKMRWPSVVFMTAQVIAHLVVEFVLDVDNLATNWVGLQGFILAGLLLINLSINLWDTKLRSKELLIKAERISELVYKCSKDERLLDQWKQDYCSNFDNIVDFRRKTLFIPQSPCVHQSLTYRDGSCFNLPDYLLVKNDIIHLFPGDKAPGDCFKVDSQSDKDNNQARQRIYLTQGQIYSVSGESNLNQKDEQKQDHAKMIRIESGSNFMLLSTPYIKSLRLSLQKNLKRPVNSVEKECFIITRKYFETFVIPMVFLLSTFVTAIHYGYLDLTDSDHKIKTISIAHLLLRPSLTIMPFLPWMFPFIWLMVNAYGSARLLCCAEAQKKTNHCDNGHGMTGYRATTKMENLLSTPTAAGSSSAYKNEDEELHDIKVKINFTRIFKVFTGLIRGNGGHVWRSSSMLQVLGSLTSLCCIDKVGILSWPNPIPEKVFFMPDSQSTDHQKMEKQSNQNQQSMSYSTSLAPVHNPGLINGNLNDMHHDHNSDTNQNDGLEDETKLRPRDYLLTPQSATGASCAGQQRNSIDQDGSTTQLSASHLNSNYIPNNYNHIPEVLDISQNLVNFICPHSTDFNQHQLSNNNSASKYGRSRQNGCSLQFDDLNWQSHLSNLKPLGLGILLNNCCEESFNDYYRFYKHVTYQSISHCKLTPVIKRRCMCDLSRLIGFSSRDVCKNYKLLNQIGIYKLSGLKPSKPLRSDESPITKNTNDEQEKQMVTNNSSTSRLKFPFPNMTCNIHEEVNSGCYHMFSQGTADMVLDMCNEFWDGKKLVRLDDLHKKKIMDFYQRTSLTSYCSAFSSGTILKSHHNLRNNCIQITSSSSNYSSDLLNRNQISLRKLYNDYHNQQMINQTRNVNNNNNYNMTHNQSDREGAMNKDKIRHGLACDETEPIASIDIRSRQQSEMPTQISTNHQRERKSAINDSENRIHLSVDDLSCLISPRKDQSNDNKLSRLMEELSDQIFVGMVATQYQACPDFVALVEQLEHACIRFIHFSRENELRSRVFSEKMGLESGWNCHISLQSDETFEGSCASLNQINHNHPKTNTATLKCDELELNQMLSSNSTFESPDEISNILYGHNYRKSKRDPYNKDEGSMSSSSSAYTLNSWKSLPSLVMKLSSRLMSTRARKAELQANKSRLKVNSNISSQAVDNISKESDNDFSETNGFASPHENKQANGLESLVFDMSNRAKLPKGIENIRPHLETVDNVPLQVSLFTDCTPPLTKEMIEIMQDYGEIVCVLGSSSSVLNTSVFLQANASIGIEPLKPEFCAHCRKVKSSKNSNDNTNSNGDTFTSKTRNKMNKKRESNKYDNVSGNAQQDLLNGNQADQQQARLQTFNKPRDRLGMAGFENVEDETRHNQQQIITVAQRRISKLSSSSDSSSSSNNELHPNTLESRIEERIVRCSSSSSTSSDLPSCSVSSKTNSNDSDSESDNYQPCKHKASNVGDGCLDQSSPNLLELFPEPMALASVLTSLPCSYNFDRRNPINLYALIMEARHFTFKMKNTFVCMICFALSISSAQFLASLLFLPPIYSSGSTIWLTIVVVPVMSLPLMSTTMESQVMKIAVGKNLQLKPENITFFVICYLIKFIPSIIVVVLSFGLIIDHSCKLTGFGASSLGPCWMFTYVKHGNDTTQDMDKEEDLLWYAHLLTAQMSSAFLTVLYFVVISSGFVHRSKLLWQRCPTTNHKWVFTSIALISGQILYSQLFLRSNLNSPDIPYKFIASLPMHVWFISFSWPIVAIGINLLVKRAEIKATTRQQRRARFDFNTKLGMNSPF